MNSFQVLTILFMINIVFGFMATTTDYGQFANNLSPKLSEYENLTEEYNNQSRAGDYSSSEFASESMPGNKWGMGTSIGKFLLYSSVYVPTLLLREPGLPRLMYWVMWLFKVLTGVYIGIIYWDKIVKGASY